MNNPKPTTSNILDELLNGISVSDAEKVRKRMLLAAKLDKAIKAKDWKKSDLAKALNKHPSEISKWLSGSHNFNLDTLFDLEEVLGVSLVQVGEYQPEQVLTYHIQVSNFTSTKNTEPFAIIPSSRTSLGTIKERSKLCNVPNNDFYNLEYYS